MLGVEGGYAIMIFAKDGVFSPVYLSVCVQNTTKTDGYIFIQVSGKDGRLG